MAGPGLAVAGRSGPGVAGAVIYRPGGLGFNPQEVRTGTGICGSGVGWAGPRRGDRAKEGSKANAGARTSSVAAAAGVGRKGEAHGLSVEVTETGAQDYGGEGD